MTDITKIAVGQTVIAFLNVPGTVNEWPIWVSSDKTVFVLEPSDNGMSATIIGVTPGRARILVTVEADLGHGTEDFRVVSDYVTVTEGTQVSPITITFGAAIDKAA